MSADNPVAGNMLSTSVHGKMSREEWRKQKDLDAARKAGDAPAELDEEGRAINPHIPEYITRAPWYIDTGRPSLNHQRQKDATDHGPEKLAQWYDRDRTALAPAAKRYRAGACENCGSMSHKRQDCVERPRKKGAKYTNKNIAPDERIQSFDSDYDGKRDRWNGYDPAEYKERIDEHEALEAARQRKREEEIDKQTSTDMAAVKKVAKPLKDPAAPKGDDDDFGSSDDDDDDADKYADTADAVGQKLDTKTRVTVRNLRMREDTAKYLRNLDIDSAYYDPKTRSMRDAPIAGNPEELDFAGDNFDRYSGDATNIAKLEVFAQNSQARGNNVHMNANPTQGELLLKQFLNKKELLKGTSKQSVLERYGGAEYLENKVVPKELLTGQTEEYVEYSAAGKVIKGRERAKARSKYEEDVFLNNHTTVWGSWFSLDQGVWGFQCCHSTISGSYCTGEAGISANQASTAQDLLEAASSSSRPTIEDRNDVSLADQHLERLRNASDKGKQRERDEAQTAAFSKTRVGEGEDVSIDQTRLKRARDDEKKRRELTDDEAWQRAKKSKLEVTEEDMEAYRLSKPNYDDPMANYKDTGDV